MRSRFEIQSSLCQFADSNNVKLIFDNAYTLMLIRVIAENKSVDRKMGMNFHINSLNSDSGIQDFENAVKNLILEVSKIPNTSGDLKIHSLVEYKELVIDLVNYGYEHGIALGISEDYDDKRIIVGFYHYDKRMKLAFDKDIFLCDENVYNFQRMVENMVDQFVSAIDIPEKYAKSIQILEGSNE